MEGLERIESNGETRHLESHFARFSDVPREIILKQDLLRVGHWFTDAADAQLLRDVAEVQVSHASHLQCASGEEGDGEGSRNL